jgi:DNA-binding NtrC family response regulator
MLPHFWLWWPHMASVAIKVSGQEMENARARPRLITIIHPTEHLIGQAPSMAALRAEIRHLATFDSLGNLFAPRVPLRGETETRKALAAQIIRGSGPRGSGPFLDAEQASRDRHIASARHRRKVHLPRREYMADSGHFRGIFGVF